MPSLCELQEKIRAAEKEFTDAVEQRMPIGDTVLLRKGKRLIRVRVVEHNSIMSTDIWVENPETGKTYKVSPTRIKEFYER